MIEAVEVVLASWLLKDADAIRPAWIRAARC
jgi:hypothetical protein